MALKCTAVSVASSSPALLSSSSSPFVASSASARMLSPLSPTQSISVSSPITCNLDQHQESAPIRRHAILTGLVASGAALSVFAADIVAPPAPAAAFTAGVPSATSGRSGEAKQKEILKNAPKLDVSGMTGPGKVSGTANNNGTLGQKLSSSYRSDSDGSRDQNVFGAPGKALQDAGNKLASTFTDKKDDVKNAAGNAAQTAKNVTNSGDLKGAADNAIGQATSKAKQMSNSGDLKGAADNAVGQAKSKADDVAGKANPGGILGSIKEGLGGVRESVAQTGKDVQNTVGDAKSKVQNSVQ